MNRLSFRLAVICAVLLLTGAVNINSTFAQSSDAASQASRKDNEINLDTQLYLVLATNQDVSDDRLPVPLDSVLKQLRAALPWKNYRIATTLINRVKNDGRLNLKWIGGPLIGGAAATTQTPSFNEFRVNNVRISTDDEGKTVIRMDGFSFGVRIPIQSGTAVAANGPAAPIINYENTGLSTDISMREGEPVIVGTLNVGPSGDAIILVMSAKRASR
jgi:hypothetical protein